MFLYEPSREKTERTNITFINISDHTKFREFDETRFLSLKRPGTHSRTKSCLKSFDETGPGSVDLYHIRFPLH